MHAEHLVTMANQIGEFFETLPDRKEAEDDIANHLRKFWEPRMRSAMLAYIDREKGAGIKDIVLSAIATHRADLEPKKEAA